MNVEALGMATVGITVGANVVIGCSSSESESSPVLETMTALEGEDLLPSCSCGGKCMTRRCDCVRAGVKCCKERCKCKPRLCTNLMEEASVNIRALGGGTQSSDEEEYEEETGCSCKTNCLTQSCKCYHLKRCCTISTCKCRTPKCGNRGIPPTSRLDVISGEVQDLCETMDRDSLLKIIESMASASPRAWSVVKDRMDPDPPNSPIQLPSWCTCGVCRPMIEAKERVCCKNDTYNHEHEDFHHIVLDDRTLRVAILNNADWLNAARRFLPATYRKAAYRQYVLWRWGHLGYGNRRVIPSCVLWKIRDCFPEPNGEYMGYMDY